MSLTKKVPVESPSKRLRNTFFRLWEKDDGGFEDFNHYYEDKIEKLISHYSKFIK